MLAAPLAAYLVRILPTRLIGVGAGGMIVASNAHTILDTLNTPTWVAVGCYTISAALWSTLLTWAIRRTFAERRAKATIGAIPQTETVG